MTAGYSSAFLFADRVILGGIDGRMRDLRQRRFTLARSYLPHAGDHQQTAGQHRY